MFEARKFADFNRVNGICDLESLLQVVSQYCLIFECCARLKSGQLRSEGKDFV